MAIRTGSDLLKGLASVFTRLGTPEGYNGSKTPRINDADADCVMEYAVSKHLQKLAKAREEKARIAVLETMHDRINELADTTGRVNIFTSAFATLDVQIAKGPSRLDPNKVRVALAKYVGNLRDVDRIMDECTVHSEPQLRMTPTVVQLGDE